MASRWQLRSSADLADAAEVVTAVLPPLATWSVRQDLPFFDQRLLIDLASTFIATSFLVRVHQANEGQMQFFLPSTAMATVAVDVQTEPSAVDANSDGAQTVEVSRAISSKPTTSLPSPTAVRGASPRKSDAAPGSSSNRVRIHDAVCCHCHQYQGIERLALELVPRCQALKEQLHQSVQWLCVPNKTTPGPWQTEAGLREMIGHEVERFLNARLVVCDLGRLLEYDCFEEEILDEDDDVFMAKDSTASLGSRASPDTISSARGRRESGGKFGRSQPEVPGRQSIFDTFNGSNLCATSNIGNVAGGVLEAVRRAAEAEAKEALLERAMKRFNRHFWNILTTGVASSLFGSRKDLTHRFRHAADEIYDRFQGELRMAWYSLMGSLPANMSDGLFLAFINIQVGAAVRQRSEKYAMLLNCVISLGRASGRYILVATPSWYIPLAEQLGGLGRLHEIRQSSAASASGRPFCSLYLFWLNPCLEPRPCIAGVDMIWGGAVPGVRAKRALCLGIESLGLWLLRMTLGHEKLLSVALETLGRLAPLLEEAYNELVAKDIFQKQIDFKEEEPILGWLAANICSKMITKLSNQKKSLPQKSTTAPEQKTYLTDACEPDVGTSKSILVRASTPSTLKESKVHALPNILVQLHRGSNDMNTYIDPDEFHRWVHSGKAGKWSIGRPENLFSIYNPSELPVLSYSNSPSRSLASKKSRSLSRGLSRKLSSQGTGVVATSQKWFTASPQHELTSCRSAPQLQHPKSFSEQLADMAALSKRSSVKKKARPKSAPAAIDSSDFDAGDILRNSAIVLALQQELLSALTVACAEGPLPTFWRQGRTAQEETDLRRLRLSVGGVLLFAALRAPLPVETPELSIRHFTSLLNGKKDETSGDSRPSAATGKSLKDLVALPGKKDLLTMSLPDGLFAMGFAAIFHTAHSQTSAQFSARSSFAFNVALPQAALNSTTIFSQLREKSAQGFRWREGSLLTLLSTYAMEECYQASTARAEPFAWCRQEHGSFFSTACCFRVLLGLEMANIYKSSRPTDYDVQLLEIFPFLIKVDSLAKYLSANLDMSGAKHQRPLLRAPVISPETSGTFDFDPHFAEWGQEYCPGGICSDPGVPLIDFAAWVGNLRPGRVIYSSFRSKDSAHLYLRLKRCVVILDFVSLPNDEPITSSSIFRRYRNATGEAKWWGPNVHNVYYIIMASKLETKLEALFQGSGSRFCAHLPEDCYLPGYQPAEVVPMTRKRKSNYHGSLTPGDFQQLGVGPLNGVDGSDCEDDDNFYHTLSSLKRHIDPHEGIDGRVRPRTEVLICAAICLDRLLGPLKNSVYELQRLFAEEIALETTGKLQAREDAQRARANRERRLGRGRQHRTTPPNHPSKEQLDLNFEALKGMLEYIMEQTNLLTKAIDEQQDIEGRTSVLGSRASSVGQTPTPTLPPLPRVYVPQVFSLKKEPSPSRAGDGSPKKNQALAKAFGMKKAVVNGDGRKPTLNLGLSNLSSKISAITVDDVPSGDVSEHADTEQTNLKPAEESSMRDVGNEELCEKDSTDKGADTSITLTEIPEDCLPPLASDEASASVDAQQPKIAIDTPSQQQFDNARNWLQETQMQTRSFSSRRATLSSSSDDNEISKQLVGLQQRTKMHASGAVSMPPAKLQGIFSLNEEQPFQEDNVAEENLQVVEFKRDADPIWEEQRERLSEYLFTGPVEDTVLCYNSFVKFPKDLQEPKRTSKSLTWRPPTPHPLQAPEVTRRLNMSNEAIQDRERIPRASSDRGIRFDFAGFGTERFWCS